MFQISKLRNIYKINVYKTRQKNVKADLGPPGCANIVSGHKNVKRSHFRREARDVKGMLEIGVFLLGFEEPKTVKSLGV